MAIQQNFPDEGPTLNLNFAGSRTLDPRITFTRTSSATHMGPDGLIKIAPVNSPRFDHSYNPTTGEVESLGLLIEEQRQNLWNSSNDFTVWTKQTSSPGVVGVATTTATTSPDGTFNAYRYFAEVGGGSFYSIFRGVAGISSNTSYCYSTFLKAGEVSNVGLVIFDGPGAASGNFNLSSGSINFTFNSTNTTIGAGTTITNYGNGWYRCAVVFSSTLSGNGFQFKIDLDGPPSAGQGLFVYGAQLEAGAFPTSYIPTTASTVTRTADSVSMTGSNFSSWFNPNEGTLFGSARSFSSTARISGLASLNNPDPSLFFNNRVDIRYYQGGSSIGQFNTTGIFNTSGLTLTSPKFISAYKLNDTAFAVNSNLITSSSAFTPSTNINTLQIGTFDNFSYHLCGTISQLTYYPTRLPNNILQNLTR